MQNRGIPISAAKARDNRLRQVCCDHGQAIKKTLEALHPAHSTCTHCATLVDAYLGVGHSSESACARSFEQTPSTGDPRRTPVLRYIKSRGATIQLDYCKLVGLKALR
jgi:hypothetical protein